MKKLVDARGLSCPQPVLLTLAKLKKGGLETVEALVDNDVSRENVCRAAKNQGWAVLEVIEEPGQYRIIMSKSK